MCTVYFFRWRDPVYSRGSWAHNPASNLTVSGDILTSDLLVSPEMTAPLHWAHVTEKQTEKVSRGFILASLAQSCSESLLPLVAGCCTAAHVWHFRAIWNYGKAIARYRSLFPHCHSSSSSFSVFQILFSAHPLSSYLVFFTHSTFILFLCGFQPSK